LPALLRIAPRTVVHALKPQGAAPQQKGQNIMMMLAAAIMSRRIAMLPDTVSQDPVKRSQARAEWAEAAREKTVLAGMMMNPFMWNPFGMAAIGGYAAGKMASNYARLYHHR
jgi:hypothetical protein